MAIKEPTPDQEYVVRYMAALHKRGIRNVPESQALKDRVLWPELAPADAAAERSDLQWEDPVEPEQSAPVAETPISPPAEKAPVISAPVAEKVPAPSRRQTPTLRIASTTTYEVGNRSFTDVGAAVLHAYTLEMEAAVGTLLDPEVLRANAQRILDLTADFIHRTKKDD